MRLLVVEDDAMVAQGIRSGLTLQNFVVDVVDSAAGAEAALAASRFDACLLDLGLPDRDGMTLLSHWRARQHKVPVIVLTARDAVAHRVQALNAGADDYVLKPFDLDEIGARVHAVVRRAAGHTRDVVELGALRVTLSSAEVLLNEKPVALARREWALLRALLQHPQRILTAEQLQDSLYGYADSIESNSLNVHIHKLRRKLGPNIVETIRGLGYRLGAA